MGWDPKEFGATLRELRTKAAVGQEELAKAAGLSADHVWKMEHARGGRPRRGTLERLLDGLNTPPAARAALLAKAGYAAPSGNGARSAMRTSTDGSAAPAAGEHQMFISTTRGPRRGVTTTPLPPESLKDLPAVIHDDPAAIAATAIKLLRATASLDVPTPPLPRPPIRMTFFSDDDLFDHAPHLRQIYFAAIRLLLERGHTVEHLWSLFGSDDPRALKLVEDTLDRLGMDGVYRPRVVERETPTKVIGRWPLMDLLITPLGALLMFPTAHTDFPDTAFLFLTANGNLDFERIQALEGRFKMLAHLPQAGAKPALHVFPSDDASRLQWDEELTAIETMPGDRWMIKGGGLSVSLVPPDIWRTRTDRAIKQWRARGGDEADQKIEFLEQIAETHRRDFALVRARLRDSHYRDVALYSAVETFVATGRSPTDDWVSGPAGNEPFSEAERRGVLAELRARLIEPDLNYEIALLAPDDCDLLLPTGGEETLQRVFWMIKQDAARSSDRAFIQTERPGSDGQDHWLLLSVPEPVVAGAFCLYAEKLWQRIPRERKDPTEVLKLIDDLDGRIGKR